MRIMEGGMSKAIKWNAGVGEPRILEDGRVIRRSEGNAYLGGYGIVVTRLKAMGLDPSAYDEVFVGSPDDARRLANALFELADLREEHERVMTGVRASVPQLRWQRDQGGYQAADYGKDLTFSVRNRGSSAGRYPWALTIRRESEGDSGVLQISTFSTLKNAKFSAQSWLSAKYETDALAALNAD